jgi:hypothetical protein
MKIAILGILQCIGLVLGISFIASVAPHLGDGYVMRVLVGASGVVLVVGALTARDYIAKLASKR